MDIDNYYQRVITQIAQGSRALVRYSESEILKLEQELKERLSSNDHAELEKILCLIDHSAMDEPLFASTLLSAMQSSLPPRLMVFVLNCARKHIIQSRFKRGNRLEYDFLEALKKLLFSDSPELVEWTLRTIEECGSQGVYFLREFDKIKPPPWKWFNANQRAVREIITMLERRWSRFEKPSQ